AGAMGERREIAEHHAEAMIERHGDTQPVLRRQPHRFADKEPVVENVVVRKRRALRKAGSAGCELDVDRLVELQLGGELRDALGFCGAASLYDFGEAERSRMPAVANENDRAQRRQARGFEFAGLSMTEFRRQLAEHADVIRGLELFGEDEPLATDFG